MPDNQRICVILHMYYQDLWDDIEPYLKNLEAVSEYDLYITVTEGNPKLTEHINSAFSNKVNVRIEQIENVPQGADLYPFIEMLNKIDLENYDIVYKIHSKQNLSEIYRRLDKSINKRIYIGGPLWRNFLINEILGKHSVKKCIQIFKNKPQIGVVGFLPLLIKVNEKNRKIFQLPSKLYETHKTRVPSKLLSEYSFIGGTIFATRSNILKLIQNRYQKEDFIDNSNRKFSEFTWDFENFLGYIVTATGYKFSGANIFSNKIILEFLSRKSFRWLFKLYVNKAIFGRNIV